MFGQTFMHMDSVFIGMLASGALCIFLVFPHHECCSHSTVVRCVFGDPPVTRGWDCLHEVIGGFPVDMLNGAVGDVVMSHPPELSDAILNCTAQVIFCWRRDLCVSCPNLPAFVMCANEIVLEQIVGEAVQPEAFGQLIHGHVQSFQSGEGFVWAFHVLVSMHVCVFPSEGTPLFHVPNSTDHVKVC